MFKGASRGFEYLRVLKIPTAMTSYTVLKSDSEFVEKVLLGALE